METHREAAAERALQNHRGIERRPIETLEEALRQGVVGSRAPEPLIRAVEPLRRNQAPHFRASYRRVLIRLAQGDPGLKLLQGEGSDETVRACAFLARHWNRWVRMPEAWQPDSRNRRRRLASLIRWCLAKYPVPEVLETPIWERLPGADPDWYVHVAQGGNLCTAERLPVPLTRRMAHAALNLAPGGLNLVEAIRWAQVTVAGGTERLARAVTRTSLGRELGTVEEEAFWLTVLDWAARQEELDPQQVGPLLDYLRARRFGDRVLRTEADPRFSMKGRTVRAVRELEREWHRELARVEVAPRGRAAALPPNIPDTFAPSGFGGLTLNRGKARNPTVWTVREILTFAELVAEGREMHHCVASYWSWMESGRCSIWSLRMLLPGAPAARRMATLEVQNQRRAIVQARGPANRGLTPQEVDIVAAWAIREGLELLF